jgi:putative ABC transport system permease protein
MAVAHARYGFIPNPARGTRVLVSPAVLAVIGSNLFRRPARTALTAIGIAIGVATIVALLSVTSGLKKSAGDLIHLGDADIGIFQKGVADPTASILPDQLTHQLQRANGVQLATPLLLVVEGIAPQPSAIVFGMDPDGFVAHREVYLKGRFPAAPNQIGVGSHLADELKVGLGGTVKVMNKPFTVSGVYQSGTFFEDAGASLQLKAAQTLAQRTGEGTTVALVLKPGSRTATVRRAILRANPNLQAIASPDDAARAGGNSQLIGKAVVVIVVLALIIGGIAVANTMAMAVLERQREFALMATIGWSPTRVAALVLGEGVGVSLIGAALGLLLGVVGAGLLVDALGASSYASPEVTAWGLGRGLLVGVAIGVLGGLYPAWRVSRLDPGATLARS